MIRRKLFESKSLIFPATRFSIFFVLVVSTTVHSESGPNYALGLKIPSSFTDFSFAFNKQTPSVISLHGYIPGARPRFLDNIKQEVEIESFDSFVVVRQTVLKDDVRLPSILTFDEYRSLVQQESLHSGWQAYVVSRTSQLQTTARGDGGINLDIPVKIKSKAFQKIFGSGTVGLSVSGDIHIKAGLRRENRSEVRSVLTRGANTNFKMEQTQRFSVTGKIGDKVTVNVDQDSERPFDFENNIRINYQGYEDDILQRLEAGNISLSLPGTRYVTFSGKNSGLFGIKSQMVLGNMNITTIASQEKGESQRISLSGGAKEGAKRILDYQYLRNTYFFLDDGFRSAFPNYDQDGNHLVSTNSPPPIIDVEVYKAAAGYETQFPDESVRAWATLNAVAADTVNDVRAGFADIAHFIRLEKSEYFFEPTFGYIRLNNSAGKEEILAVTYTFIDPGTNQVVSVGDTVGNTVIFKLIKPENPVPTDATWDLEWKHVYSLGGRNIEPEGFDVKIFFKPPSGVQAETNRAGLKWLEVFGLDTKNADGNPNPDGEIDQGSFFVDLLNGELHFPDLRPFDPEGYFVNGGEKRPDLDGNLTSAIYDTTVQSVITAESKFFIEVKTKSRSTDFNLGFNVIEGSETVTLDNETLRNGTDYTIDYFTGSLTILDERASNPASQLDISYERNQLFQLAKKTILGMRAEYDLGKNSFLGATLLYLNESTLDRKVRVGRGPIRNLVWDLNTRMNFNPNFIGRAFDFLPLLRARGETALNFEGEIAQVLPTPNTLNSPDTGDNRGVAYIDDFEAAKKTVSLGILRRNWTSASQPRSSLFPFHDYTNLVNFIWFNPIEQVSIKEIFPERDVNPNVPNRVHVLSLRLFPNSQDPDVNTWGGVMRALSPGVFDQSQTKFIEVMVRGEQGRLHIDLGSISEDVIPNGALDTEDTEGGFKNGILDEGEDLGLDGYAKSDPPQLNFDRAMFSGQNRDDVPYDFWDINGDKIKDPDEPWSYDNWFYLEQTADYIQEDGRGSIDGTENNNNDEGGRRPDSEDINGNGIVDRANSYFSYSFSLDSTSADASLIVGGNPKTGWKLYRIPFETGDPSLRVGDPNPTQIEYVRLWMDGVEDFTQPISASIAALDLVGSEWKELGSTANEFELNTGLQDTTVVVTQINTHEDPEYAATLSDIGVEGEEDRVTRVRAREQSLVLKATDLDPSSGLNAGVVQKNLFQGENYIHYERIRMFVYGLEDFDTDEHIPSDTSKASQLEYFVRFGADKNNYYEYRSTIYDEWNARNHMDVHLQEFTNFDRSDSSSYEPARDAFVKYLLPDSSKSIRVKGSPSLTNVRTLMLGIRNLHPTEPFNGQVWFNELRLSDVEQDKGMAMRFRGNMKIGDFATINGEVERKTADFHNVAQRFGTGDNSLSTNLNANVSLENFLPQSWGVTMPLSLNYRQSRSTPKYFPGKDRLVTDDITDQEKEEVRSIRSQNGFNVSFRRKQNSDNFFLKNTLDKITFNLGRSETRAENPTTEFSNGSSWTGNLDYRIDFGKNNSFTPLSWLPSLPLISKVKGTKFYFTPQNVSFRVNGTKTNQESKNRIQSTTQEAPIRETETFNVDRSVRANMKIFESLTMDYSRAHKADMRRGGLLGLFNGDLEDVNIAQTLSGRYTPTIFGWLNNAFSYSSNYTFNNNIQQRTTGRSARANTTMSADFTLRWQQLANSIFGSGEKSSTPRGRPRPGQGRTRPGEAEPDPSQEDEDEGGGISINPLRLMSGFISKFKDFSFNYTQRQNVAHLGLAEGHPSLLFQFGLSDTTDVATVDNLTSNNITSGNNNTFRVGSGLALGREFDVGLTFQHSDQRNETTTISGSSSDSWLQYKNFDLPFPEWTVRVSGLEKLPLFSKIFKTVSFSHAFSGQRDITWNGTPDNETQKSFSTNFRPLGKLDLNFSNGITGSMQVNNSTNLSRSLAVGGGARRTTRSDISLTANYSKRSGFRVPIWPFNKKELKNSIDFSFSFTASSVLTEQSRGLGSEGEDQFEEQDKTTRWSAQPKLTYSFSTQVRGGAFLEVGKTNSKRAGETSIMEFGIDINIAIRGN